jgi:2,3-dihydroxybenzoate decarboxylase
MTPVTEKSPRLYSVEESFMLPEIVAELSRLAGGKPSMLSGPIAGPFMPKLLDIGAGRIAEMDADGVDVQVLAVSAPGVQSFSPETGLSLAKLANDRLSEAVKAHPDRFAGLAVAPPQDAPAAARELERAVTKLGLKGIVINSHVNGEYLDQPKFWPLLEAIEALDVPLYLHPRDPAPVMAPKVMIPGFVVGWSYAVETGTHALQLIASGIFDRFPKLRVVLGHLGEEAGPQARRIFPRPLHGDHQRHEFRGAGARRHRHPRRRPRDVRRRPSDGEPEGGGGRV